MINKLDINQIEAGQGLGVLKFGLDREAVALILGQPNEKESYSYGTEVDDLTESWHYNDLELSLGFDEEDDWRLVIIAITSSDYTFNGFSPIGLSKEALINEMGNQGIIDLELEDWSSIEVPHELLTSDALGINFWFDDDRLAEVQWGPLFIDNETIDWPAIDG